MGAYKDRLLQREKDLAEGKYPELALKAENPVEWEILFTRLQGLVHNSRETAKRITASPVVREQGEFIFGLMTPEGESICYSSGLLLHIASLGATANWMLKNDYEEDPGIRQGDFFFNNDAYLGGAHPQDQAIVTPIYYQGKLIGWAGGLSHVPETGSPEPGGNLPSSQSRFAEGLVLPCVKIAENDKVRRDLDIMVDRDTRLSVWWLLDNRAKIAGTKMIRDGVLALVKEYGIDYYMKAVYEYIEDTRQACQRRIAQVLFPGTYRGVVYLDIPYVTDKLRVRIPIDYLNRFACQTTVAPDGVLSLDYDSTSPAGLHPYNASPIATRGMIGCLAIQHLFYDTKYNQGVNQCVSEADRALLPVSTMNPPDRTYATGLFCAAFSAATLFLTTTARAYYTMGYREELCGYLAFPIRAVGSGPRDAVGRRWTMQMFEYACSGVPPSAVHDGLDCAAINFNPEGDMGDVETWEKIMGMMYLGRYPLPDTGGFGKYRGGNCLSSLWFLAHGDEAELAATRSGDHIFGSLGMMGGYPASANYRYISLSTNLEELKREQKPLPHREEDPVNPSWQRLVSGNHLLLPGLTMTTQLRKYDIWSQFNGGAGGFGDPIERDPALVKKDLELELTTLHTAEKVYGVAVNPQTLEIDYDATCRLREAIRQARKARGIPAREYVNKEREKVIRGVLPPNPKKCLNECMEQSERFRKEFKEFWSLPQQFGRIG